VQIVVTDQLGTSLLERSELHGHKTSSIPKDATASRSTKKGDPTILVRFRDRVKVVEQQLKSTQGFVSMWKSKLKAADE
jgi:hypothetical protein